MTETLDREALKQAVIAERGYWHPFHEGLLQMSPDFLRAYLDFVAAPWRSRHLDPKVREFIYIAIDASVTHLYERGLSRHIERALELGATQEEVLQVIELTCAMGLNTHEQGISILVEELRVLSPAIDAEIADLGPEEKRIKDEFIAAVGHWPGCGDALLKLAPDFVRGFLSFRSVAWNAGCGATGEEVSEVLQLASAIAIHTCTYGVPALVEAVAKRAQGQS